MNMESEPQQAEQQVPSMAYAWPELIKLIVLRSLAISPGRPFRPAACVRPAEGAARSYNKPAESCCTCRLNVVYYWTSNGPTRSGLQVVVVGGVPSAASRVTHLAEPNDPSQGLYHSNWPGQLINWNSPRVKAKQKYLEMLGSNRWLPGGLKSGGQTERKSGQPNQTSCFGSLSGRHKGHA